MSCLSSQKTHSHQHYQRPTVRLNIGQFSHHATRTTPLKGIMAPLHNAKGQPVKMSFFDLFLPRTPSHARPVRKSVSKTLITRAVYPSLCWNYPITNPLSIVNLFSDSILAKDGRISLHRRLSSINSNNGSLSWAKQAP